MTVKDIVVAILFAIGIVALLLAGLWVLSVATTKTSEKEIDYNDKCYIEVEGNEGRAYPIYELHPWADCEE